MNVPQLRFDGFDGEWEEAPLSKLGDFMKGMALSKADISKDGEPCILYGELYTKYGPVIQKIFSKTDSQIEKKVFGTKNDVLIPSSGETAIDIACASALEVENVLLGGDLNLFRPNEDVNGSFLSYQINGVRKFELSKLAQGASVVHLYSNSLKKFKIKLPTLEEQQKIASFLKFLDKKIEKQQEKIEKLEQLKKGMMQKIFSQELRFKDEDGGEFGEWEECALKEIVDFCRSGLSLVQNSQENGVKVTRIETISEGKINISKVGYVKTEKDISEYKLQVSDILFSNINSVAHIGKLAIVKEDYNLYHGMNLLCIRTNKSNDGEFLYYLLSQKQYKSYFQKICNQAVNQASINQTELLKTRIFRPSLKEQKSIAYFFGLLDSKKEKEKEKLMVLKEQKKGFMQGMFV